jgi:hypothetical protein
MSGDCSRTIEFGAQKSKGLYIKHVLILKYIVGDENGSCYNSDISKWADCDTF